jgi:hypothetical protein
MMSRERALGESEAPYKGGMAALLAKCGHYDGRMIELLAADAVGQHASFRLAHFGFDCFSKARNAGTDEREDQKAKADDSGGQNHPVNGHGASFVFQECGELGHGLVPF